MIRLDCDWPGALMVEKDNKDREIQTDTLIPTLYHVTNAANLDSASKTCLIRG